MIIKTKFFGEIDFPENEIILFPFGVYGFEEYNRFILLHDEDDEDGMFMYLQCVDEESLCFIVIEPRMPNIDIEYSPKVSYETLRKVGAETESGIRYLVMSVIRENIKESTVNLRSPIIINPQKRVALQLILDSSEPQNSKYQTKQSLFDLISLTSCGEYEEYGQPQNLGSNEGYFFLKSGGIAREDDLKC